MPHYGHQCDAGGAPLLESTSNKPISVGIRAGDILLATTQPRELSARNVIAGTIVSLRQQDVTVIAEVDCGAKFLVHLTPGACRSLELEAGKFIWLVVKTYSCHVLQ